MRRSGVRQGRAKAPSQRQLRVGEEIRHLLAEVFRESDFRDPQLQGSNITVTEVRISPDLRKATAFVVPLGGEQMDSVVAALNRAAGYLRVQLGQSMRLRYTPQIEFTADRSFDEAGRIEAILRRPNVSRDLTGPQNGEASEEDSEA